MLLPLLKHKEVKSVTNVRLVSNSRRECLFPAGWPQCLAETTRCKPGCFI